MQHAHATCAQQLCAVNIKSYGAWHGRRCRRHRCRCGGGDNGEYCGTRLARLWSQKRASSEVLNKKADMGHGADRSALIPRAPPLLLSALANGEVFPAGTLRAGQSVFFNAIGGPAHLCVWAWCWNLMTTNVRRSPTHACTHVTCSLIRAI